MDENFFNSAKVQKTNIHCSNFVKSINNHCKVKNKIENSWLIIQIINYFY